MIKYGKYLSTFFRKGDRAQSSKLRGSITRAVNFLRPTPRYQGDATIRKRTLTDGSVVTTKVNYWGLAPIIQTYVLRPASEKIEVPEFIGGWVCWPTAPDASFGYDASWTPFADLAACSLTPVKLIPPSDPIPIPLPNPNFGRLGSRVAGSDVVSWGARIFKDPSCSVGDFYSIWLNGEYIATVADVVAVYPLSTELRVVSISGNTFIQRSIDRDTLANTFVASVLIPATGNFKSCSLGSDRFVVTYIGNLTLEGDGGPKVYVVNWGSSSSSVAASTEFVDLSYNENTVDVFVREGTAQGYVKAPFASFVTDTNEIVTYYGKVEIVYYKQFHTQSPDWTVGYYNDDPEQGGWSCSGLPAGNPYTHFCTQVLPGSTPTFPSMWDITTSFSVLRNSATIFGPEIMLREEEYSGTPFPVTGTGGDDCFVDCWEGGGCALTCLLEDLGCNVSCCDWWECEWCNDFDNFPECAVCGCGVFDGPDYVSEFVLTGANYEILTQSASEDGVVIVKNGEIELYYGPLVDAPTIWVYQNVGDLGITAYGIHNGTTTSVALGKRASEKANMGITDIRSIEGLKTRLFDRLEFVDNSGPLAAKSISLPGGVIWSALSGYSLGVPAGVGYQDGQPLPWLPAGASFCRLPNQALLEG